MQVVAKAKEVSMEEALWKSAGKLRGSILIGMDILENWDIHIGKNDIDETIFLAFPKDQINDDYLLELENTFHLDSSINAAVANRLYMISPSQVKFEAQKREREFQIPHLFKMPCG